ncbi:MAG: YceI family protein [Flavobacteriia bacterium]|nr:YceI family protein [Flavobacteriia bacterium]
MKTNNLYKLATLSILWVAFAFMTNTEWKISKEFAIQFSNNDVTGVFKKFEGKILFDKDELASSKLDFTVDIASVNTGNETQNKHLMNREWLDAERYPKATFKSIAFVKQESDYIVNGTLEIHGIKKEIMIPIAIQYKDSKGEIKSKFTFNRYDFNVGKKGDGVDENIQMEITIPFEK